MTLQDAALPEILISPFTFLQVYQSSSILMETMLEDDATFRRWFGSSGIWRTLARFTVLPTYYHWATSAYGATIDNHPVGWLYLRGWHQVLYIETLATHPGWRRQGVGSALLRFAEYQGRELNREWLGLTVTLSNTDAVRLYEKEGYRRDHWRVMVHAGELKFPALAGGPVRLQPVFGFGAERAYRGFTRLDVEVGDPWAAGPIIRFLDYNPHRRMGQEWVVLIDEQPAAFLNRHGPRTQPALYLACGPQWWGKPEMLKAIQLALGSCAVSSATINLRLGSSGHHEAALPVLSKADFAEEAAVTTRMFKNLLQANLTPT